MPLLHGEQTGWKICLQDSEQLPCWLLPLTCDPTTELTRPLRPAGAPWVLEISVAFCSNSRHCRHLASYWLPHNHQGSKLGGEVLICQRHTKLTTSIKVSPDTQVCYSTAMDCIVFHQNLRVEALIR